MTVSARALTVPAKNYTDKATKLAISRPRLKHAPEGRKAAKKLADFRDFRGISRNDLEVSEVREKEQMVPGRGLEPPRPCERQHLKLVRLPIPPSGH
jgi:hypothetical protein